MGADAAQPASALPDRAERRQLTLVFCDVVDSVALSTRLDPEDLRDFIAAYQRACAQSVQRYDGYVARYVGDGILIYFGYPTAHEDDAERAICAAIDIVAAVGQLPDLGAEAQLRVRIGIATGVVVVGDAVAEGVLDRDAVVGEAANLAARLQGVAEPNSVVVSEVTRQLAGERFAYRDLGPHELKGFAEPIPAYRVVERREVTRLQARGGALAPLIGREEELSLMLDLWERAALGDGQVVVLVGQPGIGKSRIAAEVVRLIRERSPSAPAPVMLQYSPYHSNAPLYPVVRYVAHFAGITPEDLPAVQLAKLASVFGDNDAARREDLPVIADLLGMEQQAPSLTPINPAARRHRGIEALASHLADSGESDPSVVVFEDAHWIDPTSKLLLGHLADRAKTGRSFVVITTRLEAGGRANRILQEIGVIDREGRHPSHVTIREIGELAPEDIRILASAVSVAAGDLDPEQLEAVLSKAGGIPLYAEELVKASVKGFDIVGGRGSGDHDAVPAAITDALMAQLDRLSGAKEIAQLASVIGREFSLALVAEVAHRPAAHLLSLLDRLVEAGIVVSDGGPDDAYRFHHALIRDISYRSLLRKNRRQIHGEVARALSRGGSKAAGNDLIAQHYSLGAAPIEAIEFWKRGAAEAIARSANEEAIAMLTSALAELQRLKGAQPALELELVLAQAMALRSLRGYSASEVEERLARARELCTVSGDAETKFSVEWGLFQCTMVKGEIEGARALAAGLLEHAGDAPSPTLIDALLANGMVAFNTGEFELSARFHQTGAELSVPETDLPRFQTHGQNAGLFCLSYLARTQCVLGQLDRARATIERARAIAAERAVDPGHRHGHLNAAIHAVRVYHLCDELAAEKRLADEVVELARRAHYAYYQALGMCHLGWVLGAEGEVEGGIAMLREGMAGLSDSGASLSLPGFYLLLAQLHLRADNLDDASQSLSKAVGSQGFALWDAEIERVRGDILARRRGDDKTAIEAAYRSSLTIARRQRAQLLICKTGLSFARWLGECGRHTESHQLLNGCLAPMEEGHAVAIVRQARIMMNTAELMR